MYLRLLCVYGALSIVIWVNQPTAHRGLMYLVDVPTAHRGLMYLDE